MITAVSSSRVSISGDALNFGQIRDYLTASVSGGSGSIELKFQLGIATRSRQRL